jgi:molybdopterin/thiamine biosynthesis adenylyltransferase
MLAHFGTLLPEVPHTYVVINQTHATGTVQLGGHRRALGMIRVVSTPIRHWPSTLSGEAALPARDNRQVGALGEWGVRALRQSTIGIVGLGGAGSQVAEMLAHAGVGGLILADGDKVEEVNLSRTHGTSPASVGISKVRSAERLVKRISPETEVSAIEEAFPSKRLTAELRDVALIVACVDTPHTRNELNRFALRYAIPLLDLGTTITAEPFAVDGHLSLAIPGGHCLRCAGHVSDAQLEEVDEAARRGHYGTNEGRPQVVSFNGLLASAAVTETLKVLTGFAGDVDGSREWHYDALTGQLRRVGLGPARCRECSWYGMKADNL